MAMTYGHVYVARVAFGAKDAQTVKAFLEAESYPGPSLIIAYSHCIAHGYDLALRRRAAEAGGRLRLWPLYRYDPRRIAPGRAAARSSTPAPPKIPSTQYMRNETRFRMVEQLDPERFKRLPDAAETQTRQRVAVYEQLAEHHRAAGRRRRGRRPSRARGEELGGGRPWTFSTTYLGLKLPHPLMPGASPLVDDLDTVRRLEDAGAAAIVMHSLFEEQITREQVAHVRRHRVARRVLRRGAHLLPEPRGVPPRARRVPRAAAPDQGRRCRSRSSPRSTAPRRGGWLEYAQLIEQAGADALELNVYYARHRPRRDRRARSSSARSRWSRGAQGRHASRWR